MNRIIWMVLLGFSSAAGAQDAFQGNSGTATLPPDLYNAAEPAPDLRKYLSPDGRFIDTCRYWRDHPDSTTLQYGQPDHFSPGQIGQTRSFNGQPAPYVRCAVNPCPPNGYICWRNPAKPTTLTAQIQATLKAQGCEAEPNGDIYCRKNRLPHPGPPSPTLSSELVKSVCRVIGTGISCDPNSRPAAGSSSDRFNGRTPSEMGLGQPDYIRAWVHRWQPPPPPPPALRPRYAPLDWSQAPPCPRMSSSPNTGPVINYFWLGDPHNSLYGGLNWISDSRYITVGGHGAPGAKGLSTCGFREFVVPPRQIAADIHALLILPGNAGKRVRLAGCETADADPKDGNSVPTAQQVADAYRELYGTPISVEGFNGNIQYDKPGGLQGYSCRVFTSRPPLPEN